MGVESMSGESGRKGAKMELYWSCYTLDSGLDQRVEYDHLILFLVSDCDGGQRKKVAARSYQGRRGLQRCTPQVVSWMHIIPYQACIFDSFNSFNSFFMATLSSQFVSLWPSM